MNKRSTQPMTPEEVLRFARERGAKMVDLKFTDVPGTWQHFSVPLSSFVDDAFEEGIGLDGSSIRGFQENDEIDTLLMPDPETAVMDPSTASPTLSLVCNVAEPGSARKPYSRDPRYTASKAEEYLRRSGIADTSYWGPEAEFFIF